MLLISNNKKIKELTFKIWNYRNFFENEDGGNGYRNQQSRFRKKKSNLKLFFTLFCVLK